uniref:Putative glycoside hydrolase family 35 protein n=1 Tax=Moniliophthora roreri TaxID=221103 RepID=A0A0W0G772_MONRR
MTKDNMGLNENWYTDDHMKSPRGIRNFQLNSGNSSEWKVQPNKVRGVMNERGLFGERKGWHLPDFDTSSWEDRSLSDGLPNAAAGVGFSITKFKLSIPGGYDVPISFNFDEPFGQAYRALLFVNGWNMGKRIRNFGYIAPQAKFPVHEGILNYQGENTVAVALWSMTPNVTVSPTSSLAVDEVFNEGVGKK